MKTLLNDKATYCWWRDAKLAKVITQPDIIEIKRFDATSKVEIQAILNQIQVNNFARYTVKNFQQNQVINLLEKDLLTLNQSLGLLNYDAHLYANHQGLALISPVQAPDKQGFIPYTTKALNWHTDGYYNSVQQRIRTFTLFCAKPAESGGENAWIDHELVYILLREQNSDFANALTHQNTMTIPAHQVNGIVRRPACVGAVFFIDELSGVLMMRYTQRKQNIIWADTPVLTRARTALKAILDSNTPYHHQHKMQAGQGIICHNIPHKRTAFDDNKNNPLETQRLMVRGRYFDRVKSI